MPLLYDEIYSGREIYSSLGEKAYPRISGDETIILIDNVAKYFYSFQTKENFTLPCIAPPFDDLWMEWKFPDKHFGRIGCYIGNAYDGDPSCSFKLIICSFVEVNGVKEIEHIGNISINLDEHGQEILDSVRGMMSDSFENANKDFPGGSTMAFIIMILPALLSISFMHCKNVELKTAIPPAPLSKKFKKKTGQSLVKYKILKIDPMKNILRTEGKIDTLGLKHALHICRGHFKDYSKGSGLFGKYKGLFWWDSYVRGEPSQGVVIKDYKITVTKSDDRSA